MICHVKFTFVLLSLTFFKVKAQIFILLEINKTLSPFLRETFSDALLGGILWVLLKITFTGLTVKCSMVKDFDVCSSKLTYFVSPILLKIGVYSTEDI